MDQLLGLLLAWDDARVAVIAHDAEYDKLWAGQTSDREIPMDTWVEMGKVRGQLAMREQSAHAALISALNERRK